MPAKKKPAKKKRPPSYELTPVRKLHKMAKRKGLGVRSEELTRANPEDRGIDTTWHPIFVTALKKIPTVQFAARQAAVHFATAYNHRKRFPEFAAEWDEAVREGIQHLESRAFERAHKLSDTLLIFLLKNLKPEVYGERVRSMNVNVNLDLASLTDGQLNLFEKYILEGYSEQQAFLLARNG